MRSMSVAADVLLHLSEEAIPTAENRRSTASEARRPDLGTLQNGIEGLLLLEREPRIP